jgi:phage shock protein E
VKKNVFFILLFSSSLLIADVIIDVRTAEEFQSGHLEKSINIEWQEILSISSNIDKSKKIYLYCRSGKRSQKATEILSQAGFIDVENLGSISQASEKLQVKIIK